MQLSALVFMCNQKSSIFSHPSKNTKTMSRTAINLLTHADKLFSKENFLGFFSFLPHFPVFSIIARIFSSWFVEWVGRCCWCAVGGVATNTNAQNERKGGKSQWKEFILTWRIVSVCDTTFAGWKTTSATTRGFSLF